MAATACGTILLVENDHLLRRALERLLVWEGYCVLGTFPDDGSAQPMMAVLGVGDACPAETVERVERWPRLAALPLLILGGDPGLPTQLGRRPELTACLPQMFTGQQFLAAVRACLGRAEPVEPSESGLPLGRS